MRDKKTKNLFGLQFIKDIYLFKSYSKVDVTFFILLYFSMV